jgi:hypothetical protein
METATLPQTKVCTGCGLEKPLDQFHLAGLTHYHHPNYDGYKSRCKECTRIASQRSRQLDPRKDVKRAKQHFWSRLAEKQRQYQALPGLPILSSLDRRYLIEVFKEFSL